MYLSVATRDTTTEILLNSYSAIRAGAVSKYEADVFRDGDSQLQRWSSLIGIVTAITGNILISFALNVQRYAHIRLHRERVEQREKSKALAKAHQQYYGATNGQYEVGSPAQNGDSDPLSCSFQSTSSQSTICSDIGARRKYTTYLSSPYWWGGIFLMTVGEAGNFLAYAFAPASIVSPLGVVALISNCVIAPIMLKETFRMRDFWGVIIAVGGAVTVVLSAKQEERKLGPQEIWGAITTTAFEVYMAVTVIMIGVLIWASPRFGNKTILVDLGLVGLFGGYTALSTKGVASMLSYTLWRALTTPVTYALLAVLMGTAVMQVRYVNKALQRFDSTQVIPVQFVMFTLSVIIGSAILYGDFYQATADQIGKFIGGCLLTFFGVFLITNGRDHVYDDEEESDDEAEERVMLASSEHSGAEGQYHDEPQQDTLQRIPTVDITSGGDATNDRVPGSRRSSKVSFADPSLRPGTSRLYSSSSIQPSTRVIPNIRQSDLSSATEFSPLLANPLRGASDDVVPARHPGMSSSISSPLPPSETQSPSIDSLKSGNVRPTSQSNFHTHPNHQQGPSPPQAERPGTPVSQTFAKLMPGPLLSPLSGGLSVVVADSLRRGVDSRSKHSKRLRRSKSQSHRSNVNLEDDIESSPLRKSDPNQDKPVSKSLGNEPVTWSRMTRARSLSNTLGELFRGKSQKTDPTDDDEDVGGPSGS